MENAPVLKKVCWQVLFNLLLSSVFMVAEIPAVQAAMPGGRVPREQWIRRVSDTLTLEEKIGQLFMLPVYASSKEQDIDRLSAMVKAYNIGGLVFHHGSADRQINLTRQLQQQAPFPLLIGMDVRQGPGTSLEEAIKFPSFAALGAIQNEAYLYDLGIEVARQCRALGVHINMAPILQPGVGGSRQQAVLADVISDDPAEAFSKGLRYMQGMQDHGLIPCYRQLPLGLPIAMASEGGGRSSDNLKLLGKTVAQLNFVSEGEEFSDQSLLLRTSDPQNYLYEKYLKLEGLVLSDPLTMHQGKAGELAVEALLAGNDILLGGMEVAEAIEGIRNALAQGRLQQEDIDRRLYKILRAKYMVGLDGPTLPEKAIAESQLKVSSAPLLKQYLYEEAITLVRNEQGYIPFRVLDTTSFASLTINKGVVGEKTVFQDMLERYVPFTHYTIADSKKEADYEQLFERLTHYGHVVVALYDHSSRRQLQLDKEMLSFLKFLQKQTHVTLVAFSHPYKLADLEGFSTLMCAYDDDPVAELVVPQILFGAVGAKGRLPLNASSAMSAGEGISTKPLARLGYALPEAVGLSSDTLLMMDSLAQWAIAEEATPGCQILVARKGKIVWEKSYGYQTYEKESPVTNETIYDIASVTKVAATMQAVMFLQERGTIDLDEKASAYLPELKDTDKEQITIRELLLHRAGLRSFIPFWAMTKDRSGLNPDIYNLHPESEHDMQVAQGLYASPNLRDSVWHWTIESKLRRLRGRRNPSWKPDYNYRYSDLSFYILHQLVERVTNQPMDAFLAQNFYDPLGLNTLTYLPLCKFSEERIAPTEHDKHFRNVLVRGTVHDEGAALYGGVAGHAGLFSNAHDLAILMQMNLQDGIYGGDRYFQPGTVSRFSIRQYNDSRRGLGWDKPEYLRDGGPTAAEASYASFGHLGFTGTAVWVDPKYDLVYIFLSNRIHPSARNTKLLTEGVRTKIQSVVYRAMNDYSGR
jgi:CubicO group peptidase (beta-lactamase class C family)/beta-glucosidase-like glycosyl hydrolase